MRSTKTFDVANIKDIKTKLLHWSNQHEVAFFLDSNNHPHPYQTVEALVAVDEFTAIKKGSWQAFEELKKYQSVTKDWLFGYLSYDLKNDTERLSSKGKDSLLFPELYFFQPKKIIRLEGGSIHFEYLNMIAEEIEADFEEIRQQVITKNTTSSLEVSKIKAKIPKSVYLEKVKSLLENIQQGNIYEVNFCQEFYAENARINPLEIFKELNRISAPPFASYIKIEDKYALCASPERYLKKEGEKIISQPIKGTARRGKTKTEDQALKIALANDPKEVAENIMIVDLVRNDLSKTAQKASVQVEELCKVYTFPQVHQMISTVTSQLKDHLSPIDVIKESYPMGSMTGAPKVSAMQLIESHEVSKRGLYSGAIGYFTPENDFDFNVVIRSILYNKSKKYVSFSVGSAITNLSIPEKEYEECLVKAEAMRKVLQKHRKNSSN